MHFLLVYDRARGELLSDVAAYPGRSEAMTARFELERLHRGDDNVEVVVLDAPSQEALQRTHARYFKSLRDLAAPTVPTGRVRLSAPLA